MAGDKKILTQQEMIPNRNGDRERKIVTVYYDRGRDAFYVTCPEHLLPEAGAITKEWREDRGTTITIHDGRLYASRPAATIEALLTRCHEYMHAIRKKRKMIAYHIRYDEDMHFEHDAQGLLLKWAVGWELKVGSRIQLLDYEPPDEREVTVCNGGSIMRDVRDEDLKLMEWTEDRERFFRSLTASLEALKARCKAFLGDEKRLALAIDTGTMQPLLEGPEAPSKDPEDDGPDEVYGVGACSQKLHNLRAEMKDTKDPVAREHIQREITHWEGRRHKAADAR